MAAARRVAMMPGMKYAVHDSGSRNGSHFSAVNWSFSGWDRPRDDPEQQQQDDQR